MLNANITIDSQKVKIQSGIQMKYEEFIQNTVTNNNI